MNRCNISKREMTIFFVVTFGLTILMGIVMGIIYTEHPVDYFVLLQMYYPDMGAILALMSDKERRKDLPIKFFGTYLFFSITSVLYLILQVVILNGDLTKHMGYWMIIGSITLILIYTYESDEKISNYGLKLSENGKDSFRYTILFIILYIFRLATTLYILGSERIDIIAPLIDPVVLFKTILLPLNFFIAIMPFLGEELGWRYFLQPILQKKMGKRKGVILLGFIWGIWHLPVNLFYHSPKLSLYPVLNQLIVCISYSVFLGLVYMKTENVWAVSLIHYINNNLGSIIYNETEVVDYVFNWKSFLLNSICFSLIYLSFLLSKNIMRIRFLPLPRNIRFPEIRFKSVYYKWCKFN